MSDLWEVNLAGLPAPGSKGCGFIVDTWHTRPRWGWLYQIPYILSPSRARRSLLPLISLPMRGPPSYFSDIYLKLPRTLVLTSTFGDDYDNGARRFNLTLPSHIFNPPDVNNRWDLNDYMWYMGFMNTRTQIWIRLQRNHSDRCDYNHLITFSSAKQSYSNCFITAPSLYG